MLRLTCSNKVNVDLSTISTEEEEEDNNEDVAIHPCLLRWQSLFEQLLITKADDFWMLLKLPLPMDPTRKAHRSRFVAIMACRCITAVGWVVWCVSERRTNREQRDVKGNTYLCTSVRTVVERWWVGSGELSLRFVRQYVITNLQIVVLVGPLSL